MKLSVRDFRGITSADIECAPTALLVGNNGAGKSSILQAAEACMTGNGIASRFNLDRKEASELVRKGAKTAVAWVSGDESKATMNWPEAKLITAGAEPPHASPAAVGQLQMLLSDRQNDRATMLEPYLRAAPTKDDLTAAMQDSFYEKAIAALWEQIERKGWDGAEADQQTIRRDAGRDWQKVTGVQFGADKAKNWHPADWDPNLEETDPEEIAKTIGAARTALETALRSEAVSEAEEARLQGLADVVDQRRAALDTATANATTSQEALAAATQYRAGLPMAATSVGLKCPHCGESIMVVGEGAAAILKKFEAPTASQNNDRRAAIAKADHAITEATKGRDAAAQVLRTAQAEADEAEAAITKIAAAKKRAPAGSVGSARETLATLEKNLVMVKQVSEATGLYRAWMSANLKIAILAPGGLRARKLAEAVDAFNSAILAPLCTTASWAAVNLTEELKARLGERRYELLSIAEQWRVRTILQVAMARLDGSSMLLIDELPDLDEVSRNGLFWLLADVGIPALVCMATLVGMPIPDLSQAGFGKTYVIADCVAKPLEPQT